MLERVKKTNLLTYLIGIIICVLLGYIIAYLCIEKIGITPLYNYDWGLKQIKQYNLWLELTERNNLEISQWNSFVLNDVYKYYVIFTQGLGGLGETSGFERFIGKNVEKNSAEIQLIQIIAEIKNDHLNLNNVIQDKLITYLSLELLMEKTWLLSEIWNKLITGNIYITYWSHLFKTELMLLSYCILP